MANDFCKQTFRQQTKLNEKRKLTNRAKQQRPKSHTKTMFRNERKSVSAFYIWVENTSKHSIFMWNLWKFLFSQLIPIWPFVQISQISLKSTEIYCAHYLCIAFSWAEINVPELHCICFDWFLRNQDWTQHIVKSCTPDRCKSVLIYYMTATFIALHSTNWLSTRNDYEMSFFFVSFTHFAVRARLRKLKMLNNVRSIMGYSMEIEVWMKYTHNCDSSTEGKKHPSNVRNACIFVQISH